MLSAPYVKPRLTLIFAFDPRAHAHAADRNALRLCLYLLQGQNTERQVAQIKTLSRDEVAFGAAVCGNKRAGDHLGRDPVLAALVQYALL